MIDVVTVETPSLGDRSYVVHDGRHAVVVDPQRDIDRLLQLADKLGVRIAHVVETHIHNDYLTGGLALAERTGATYHVSGADTVSFDRNRVADGDVIEVSPALRLRAVSTPGHTFNHLSYIAEDLDGPVAVFTGGSLLFGSTGRPDLMGAEHTDALVHHQFVSARRLADMLPDETPIYPTHGFGSFCSATQASTDSSTIGQERASNPVLTQQEEEYVEGLLAGLDDYPAYYARMASRNASGPEEADLTPPEPVDAATLDQRLRAGEWVVDLRNRVAFAAGHVPGTLNFGLDGSLATYLGWLIPAGTAVTVLASTPAEVTDAQRELVRIGVEQLAGAATGKPEQWTTDDLESHGMADFADLEAVRHHRAVVVLDVRQHAEWAEGHIADAVHRPLHELLDGADSIPPGEVWVHCAAGYRASVAASILAAAGRRVVAIDDDFGNAAAAGLPITT